MTRSISLVAIVVISACSGSEQSSTLSNPNDVTVANGNSSSSATGGQTTTSQDADSSFSMVFVSDPQMIRRINANGGENPDTEKDTLDPYDPACGLGFLTGLPPYTISRINLCDPIATNEAVVTAIESITDLVEWPTRWDCANPDHDPLNGCLSRGAGSAIKKPAGVVVNGDLTETYTNREASYFDEVYMSSGISHMLYPGLGNHDYKVPLDKKDAPRPDSARNAVEWMSNLLGSLPSLANHHMDGFVHVRKDVIGGKIRFRVKADGGNRSWHVVDTVGAWDRSLVGKSAQKVRVQFQEKRDFAWDTWDTIDTLDVSYPVTNACFIVRTRNWVDKVNCLGSQITNKTEVGTRAGSMSYSFDKGNYHFVQLHNHINYEVDLSGGYDTNGPDVPGSPQRQKFNIVSGEAWLESDLAEATAAGKAIIVNVHDRETGGLINDDKGNGGLQRLVTKPEYNVVAVFAGHVHNHLGLRKEWNVERDDTVVRKIPVILSGAGLCGTMIYADFRDDYFNWAAVRAWSLRSPNGETKIRPDKERVLGKEYAIANPTFVDDHLWTCESKPDDRIKQGTVEVEISEPTAPPVASCADVTVNAGPSCGAEASIDNGSYDPEGGPLAFSQSPPGPYGPGETLVTLTVVDESHVSASCEATVTVVDKTAPMINCHIPDVGPPDAPFSITTTAEDNCSVADLAISEPDCYKINGSGKRVDLNNSCRWQISENTLTILNTGGVGTLYDWLASTIDENGNESSKECQLEIQNPGL